MSTSQIRDSQVIDSKTLRKLYKFKLENQVYVANELAAVANELAANEDTVDDTVLRQAMDGLAKANDRILELQTQLDALSVPAKKPRYKRKSPFVGSIASAGFDDDVSKTKSLPAFETRVNK
jgi:hypothetical protein